MPAIGLKHCDTECEQLITTFHKSMKNTNLYKSLKNQKAVKIKIQ